MALNSLPTSARLRSSLRLLGEFRQNGTATDRDLARLEKVIGDAVADVEQMEIAAGTAPVTTQIKAAGGNIVAIKAVLRLANGRTGVRRG